MWSMCVHSSLVLGRERGKGLWGLLPGIIGTHIIPNNFLPEATNYWGYYYRDPSPHSLLSTRETDRNLSEVKC